MSTTTILASSYRGSTQLTLSSISNAYTNTSSTNYAVLSVSKKNSTGSIFLNGFNFSSIPTHAIINSVTVKVKARVSSTTYITTATVRAYKNGSAVGTASSFRTTSATTYTLSIGTWSRADLDNLELYFSMKRNNSNTAGAGWVYGIEVIVDWTEPQEGSYLKVGSTWHEVSKVFRKVNGSWVENDFKSVKSELDSSGTKLVRKS